MSILDPATAEPGSWHERFIKYHEENPEFYDLWDKFTKIALAAGLKGIGSGRIMDRIRWETAVESQSNDGFKINQNYSAYYVRLWQERNPEHAGFFRTRATGSERVSRRYRRDEGFHGNHMGAVQ